MDAERDRDRDDGEGEQREDGGDCEAGRADRELLCRLDQVSLDELDLLVEQSARSRVRVATSSPSERSPRGVVTRRV